MQIMAVEELEPITVRIPEATRLTGICRSHLYELIRAGEIEIVKVGASTLIIVESLRSFIERRRTQSRIESGGCEPPCAVIP